MLHTIEIRDNCQKIIAEIDAIRSESDHTYLAVATYPARTHSLEHDEKFSRKFADERRRRSR